LVYSGEDVLNGMKQRGTLHPEKIQQSGRKYHFIRITGRAGMKVGRF
jgi:hypothetical protein